MATAGESSVAASLRPSRRDRGVGHRALPEQSGLVQEGQVVPSGDLVGLRWVLDPELLARHVHRLGIEVFQARVVAHLGGPVRAAHPQRALLFGVSAQLDLARSGARIAFLREHDRAVRGGADGQQHNAPSRVIHDPRFHSRVRLQLGTQPREQILVSFPLEGIGIETGAHHLVRRVVDAEHQVAASLTAQAGLVRERRQILADLVGIGLVPLELQPLGLGRERAQFIDECDEIVRFHGIGSSSPVVSSACFCARMQDGDYHA